MLFTTHTALGAIIGAVSPDAGRAASVGLVSHYLCDALPHWGLPRRRATFYAVAAADGLAAAGLVAVIARTAPPPARTRMLAGALAAGAPDWNKPAKLLLGHDPTPAPLRVLHVGVQRREHPGRLRSDARRAAHLATVSVAVAAAARLAAWTARR